MSKVRIRRPTDGVPPPNADEPTWEARRRDRAEHNVQRVAREQAYLRAEHPDRPRALHADAWTWAQLVADLELGDYELREAE